MRGLVLVALVAACGGEAARPGPTLKMPERATTAGDPLLAYLPAGASAVAEIDVRRLRDNAVVAPLIAAIGRREALGIDPLHDIDAAAAAVYRLGEDDAGTLFVLRGEGLRQAKLPESERVDETTWLVGPRTLRAQERGGLTRDVTFLALRAATMPSKAGGATVRLTASLGPRARIAAAGKLVVDEVPATVSLWLDVADDAALVALLGGSDAADAARLAAVLDGARAPAFSPPRDDLKREITGRAVKVVWVLTPRKFAAWIEGVRKQIGASS